MTKISEKKVYRIIASVVLTICSLMVIIPMMVIIMSSFSDENAAIKFGYTLWPKQFSLDAYRYIFAHFDVLGRAYLITTVVTLVGTIASLIITSTFAYGLSYKELPGRKFLMFFVLFTMLFNGGLIPTYYFYVRVFHIKNTFFAYIIPNLLCSAFNIILLRNYFSNSISPALRESAMIDGCGEFRIFIRIILPLSKPILATVGMLNAISYWNDWQNGLYYMDDGAKASIQQVLRIMTQRVSFLAAQSSVPSDLGANVPGVTIRMAIAAISVVPLLALFPFFEQYYVRGITIGGVKE